MQTTSFHRFQPAWMLMSISLLIIYLVFFHICIHASYSSCALAGIVGTALWMAVCNLFRQSYLSRFEYWIHQLVGIDILLEGFSPIHEGYGFYYCAACFWAVFLTYHAFAAIRFPTVQLQMEAADAGIAV